MSERDGRKVVVMGPGAEAAPFPEAPSAPHPAGADAAARPAHDPDRDLEAAREVAEARRAIVSEIGKRIVGQDAVIEHLLIALFARGHCLFVGVPGLAKTLLIQTLADVLVLSFRAPPRAPRLHPASTTWARS